MRILITGNLGYLGPCVTKQIRLAWPHARIVGFDAGYYSTEPFVPEEQADHQIAGDIRDLPQGVFSGVNAVVHLAALSSPATCQAFEGASHEINGLAAIETARRAKKAGVRSFVFASTCSVYGPSATSETIVAEASEINPRSAYARSKAAAETALRAMASRDFTVTILRFASACGSSPGFRLDTVLNNWAAGIPGPAMAWRQLIHVRDMARAIEWAVARPAANGGSNLVVNVGSDAWTWRASELAELVGAFVPEGARAAASGRVDFTLFRRVAPLHQPREKPETAIQELKSAQSGAFRTHQLTRLVERGRLGEDLRWQALPVCLPEFTNLARGVAL